MRRQRRAADLQVSGIVRTEDITSATPSISARSPRRAFPTAAKTVSDVQEPRLGSQLFDILMPW